MLRLDACVLVRVWWAFVCLGLRMCVRLGLECVVFGGLGVCFFLGLLPVGPDPEPPSTSLYIGNRQNIEVSFLILRALKNLKRSF